MFLTKDNVYLGLQLSGQEVDFTQISFSHFTLRSHVLYYLPTLEFVIYDPTGYFQPSRDIADGTQVQVAMGAGDQDSADSVQWIPFRVFRPNPDTDGAAVRVYSVSCYFDAPAYLMNQVNKTYKGGASTIIQQIASDLGMKYSGDNTSDSMTWRCASKTLSHFLREDVVPRAYASDQSAFSLAVSHVSQQMMFKDISQIATGNPKRTLANDVKDGVDYVIAEPSGRSFAGLFNVAAGGYGLQTTGFNNVTGNFETSSGAQVRKSAGKMALNSSLTQNRAKQLFAPLNFGNVHDNYHKAQGQNLRTLSTYSQCLDVLLRQVTDIDLYDPVAVDLQNVFGKTDGDELQSGNYLTCGRGQMVTPNSYAERICLVRNSYNSDSGELT